MTVYDIVVEYLKKNKFDGLYSKGSRCSCTIKDIDANSVGCAIDDCQAGVFVPCPGEECDNHHNHIGPKDD